MAAFTRRVSSTDGLLIKVDYNHELMIRDVADAVAFSGSIK